jgi:hypothetical protein
MESDLRLLQVCGFQRFTAEKAADFEKHEVCACIYLLHTELEYGPALQLGIDIGVAGKLGPWHDLAKDGRQCKIFHPMKSPTLRNGAGRV